MRIKFLWPTSTRMMRVGRIDILWISFVSRRFSPLSTKEPETSRNSRKQFFSFTFLWRLHPYKCEIEWCNMQILSDYVYVLNDYNFPKPQHAVEKSRVAIQRSVGWDPIGYLLLLKGLTRELTWRALSSEWKIDQAHCYGDDIRLADGPSICF